MTEVYRSIDALIDYAERQLNLDKKNVHFVRNGILRLLGLEAFSDDTNEVCLDTAPDNVLKRFADACVNAGLFPREDASYFCDSVMGELMLSPKDTQAVFEDKMRTLGSGEAMQWFYGYSVKGDYVKKSQLDKNPRFDSLGLVVTINKTKPEYRDPKKAASGNATKGGYPKCSICHENEGFAGRSKRTLRTIDITLNGQRWFWQFSPYGYFNQHGIAVNYEHIPMHIDRATFSRLMDFVDMFPNYFIGCNAPLERIGGSVLAHDHYQGGGEILPMHKAKAKHTLRNPKYPDAVVEVVDWAGTVVRIVSANRSAIEEIGEAIRAKWVSYEDKSKQIVPVDDKGVHNAISPTVVKTARGYEMSIILRSNITSETYPDGIFHAHPEFHIIKKESIGLIEAQGLFILPGRLEDQLAEIEALIVEGLPLSDELKDFALVYNEVTKHLGSARSKKNVHEAVHYVLGNICNRILDNTAVFKTKTETVEFMKDLGFSL